MSIKSKYLSGILLLAAIAGGIFYFYSNKHSPDISSLKQLYKRPDPLVIPYPADNPYSEAKMVLGKMLFFEPRLSNIGIMSCATCHHPGFHFTDGLKISKGQFQKEVFRHTPMIFNLAWDELFFWDGRAPSIEEQARTAITSDREMFMNQDMVNYVLQDIPGYVPFFTAAFPDNPTPTIDNAVKAIGIFVRSIISSKAPFDLWIEGDEKAISEHAKRGFVIFNTKGNCASCHTGWRFTDAKFHDVGIIGDDIGRGKEVPDDPLMQHAFKTPGLRNVAETPPYMHNGSFATLEEVINFFDRGGDVRRDNNILPPLNLSAEEKSDLLEFLKTLSSRNDPFDLPVLPRRNRVTEMEK